MSWIILLLVMHLVFGLACAWLAYEAKQKAEKWFLFGTLFGGPALVVCLFRSDRKAREQPGRVLTGRA